MQLGVGGVWLLLAGVSALSDGVRIAPPRAQKRVRRVVRSRRVRQLAAEARRNVRHVSAQEGTFTVQVVREAGHQSVVAAEESVQLRGPPLRTRKGGTFSGSRK